MDLNLLVALDALLDTGSVTAAARRLGLSTSATSRTLARLRTATGDPLLVRAGRALVPTTRALVLRGRVRTVTAEALAVLEPDPGGLPLEQASLLFTLRVSEGFMARLAVPVAVAVAATAPRVRLRFAPKPDKNAEPIRNGLIDMEIGVLGTAAPELRVRALFRDRFVAVVRDGHPLLAEAPVTAERYASCDHVVASRRNGDDGPVDAALAAIGLRRRVAVVVPGYPDAIRMARHSDLVALVPASCLGGADGTAAEETAGVRRFPLPVRTPPITVSALWHPRSDADPVRRRLREIVMAACRNAGGTD